MDRDPPATEPLPFPIELGPRRGWRILRVGLTLFALAMAGFGAAFALGRLEPVNAAGRVIGTVVSLMGLAGVIGLQGTRLILHADRIEEISVLGLHRNVTPLSALRAYRVRVINGLPLLQLLGEGDKLVTALGAIYERPDLIFDYVSSRLVDRDHEQAVEIQDRLADIAAQAAAAGESAPDARFAHDLGRRLLGILALAFIGFFFVKLTLGNVWWLRDGLRLVFLLVTAVVAYARTRHRRLSVVREVMEPLVLAQLGASLSFLLLGIRLPEQQDAWWAVLLIAVAALPIATWDVTIDAQAQKSWWTRLKAYGFAVFVVSPWLLDGNVRLATRAPMDFEATIESLHCDQKKPHFHWRSASDTSATDVDRDDCAKRRLGDVVRGQRVHGAFGLRFLTVSAR